MPAVGLDAVDEVLDDPLRDLVTQGRVVAEDGAHRLRFQKLWKEGEGGQASKSQIGSGRRMGEGKSGAVAMIGGILTLASVGGGEGATHPHEFF